MGKIDEQHGAASFEPDWYPDPAGRHQLRYWDGTAWTDDVADNGQASTDPLSQVAPTWTRQISGTCDNCRTPTRSGRRVIFYIGELGDVQATGPGRSRITHSVGERSSVFLCEACAKDQRQAIGRTLAAEGLGGHEFWIEADFVRAAGTQFFGAANPGSRAQDPDFDPNYVKIADIVKDRVAAPESMDDATVSIPWKGRFLLGAAALAVELDDACVGLGRFTKDFVAHVRVSPGVHTLSIGPPHPTPSRTTQTIDFEPRAAYQMDVHLNRASGRYSSEIRRTA